MNEIVKSGASTRNRSTAISVEVIAMAQGTFARQKPHWISDRLGSILAQPVERNSESYVRDQLAEAEAMLADEEFRRLYAALKPAVAVATVTEIKQQIGVLLLAFGAKDVDLGDFIEIAAAEVATSDLPVSRLRLAMAFRNLRRTARFRPSIAEILDAIAEINLGHVGSLLRLPDCVKAVRLRLARGDFAQRVAQIAYDGVPDDLLPDGL